MKWLREFKVEPGDELNRSGLPPGRYGWADMEMMELTLMPRGNVRPEHFGRDAQKLREGLDRLGWTPRQAAREWKLSYRTMERWLSGHQAVPSGIWRMIEAEAKRRSPLDLGD